MNKTVSYKKYLPKNTKKSKERMKAGKKGEEQVKNSLDNMKNRVYGSIVLNEKYFYTGEKCHKISDICPELENETMQIDHIMITPSSIILIETKTVHGTGMITGGPKNKNWYHKFQKKGNKNLSSKKFLNAFKQGEAHKTNLECILYTKFGDIPIVSVVCFVLDKDIELHCNIPPYSYVCKLEDLEATIQYAIAVAETKEDIPAEHIYSFLEDICIKDEDIEEKHIAFLRLRDMLYKKKKKRKTYK